LVSDSSSADSAKRRVWFGFNSSVDSLNRGAVWGSLGLDSDSSNRGAWVWFGLRFCCSFFEEEGIGFGFVGYCTLRRCIIQRACDSIPFSYCVRCIDSGALMRL
jgi:hypothetical protein